MRIRECREEDVPLLDRHMPPPGEGFAHAPRYARHCDGTSTFLVAWLGDRPVGSCEIRWEGCTAPEVTAVHPRCPEVSGLGVWPGTLRERGVGEALIGTAERLALGRDRDSIGLGVAKNNPRAEALYKRLGYHPLTPYLDCWSYEDSSGVAHRVADACLFMVKGLDGTDGCAASASSVHEHGFRSADA
jgi:GNAT superfamily N-acetyltransferase